jgi:glycosyltransferase involved in cell wall biosynthesis
MARKVHIVHVINSFEFGGAESMLCNLVLRHDRRRFDPAVVALIDDLTVAGPLIDAGVPLTVIGMRRGVPDPRGVLKLARYLRRAKPDIVQTWMDHSNLIGGLAAKLAGVPVVWGVHHSNHVRGLAKRSTLLTVWACGKLSHALPERIVCCSEHSLRLYENEGFAVDRMSVIPNGFDTELFRPDAGARGDLRRELRIDEDVSLVGLIARFDPLKDHATFLKAAEVLSRKREDVHFVLCGAGVEWNNATLARAIHELRLVGRCHLLGPRRDMPRVQAALDMVVSSSVSEAFPLVLGEAMACGIPCVTTDVGDSALIVGLHGRVVPVRNADAIAAACEQVLSMPPEERGRLGLAGRQRICDRFGLDAVTRRYERLYQQVVACASPIGEAMEARRAGAAEDCVRQEA